MLYASYGEPEAPAAPPRPDEAPSARPWERIAEDPVDTYWAQQPGTIPRRRDMQFCRHGDKGMCDYCMPLEPYDAAYHAAQGIKHLSFHAYLRQNDVGPSAGRSTYVPPLEEPQYHVQTPCPSGQHAPWPAGICTKCQPSAITLQRQVYRMVDHVEFADPALIDNMLEIWRKTNAQRFGFLLGHYEPYPVVPMGVKAVVEAIHEPPQAGEIDGLTLGVPWDDEPRIEQLARDCGLQIVGMAYTDLEAADPTDPSKAGLVACKRHADSFFLSGAEAIFAAQLQSAHRCASRYSRSGAFNSRFVTCVLSGNPEGEIDVAVYQVSAQAMGMVAADMIEASVSPTMVRVKPSTPTRYVPDVFYRYKNKYGIDVKESASLAFPVEYLIVTATHGFPTAPAPRFVSHAFPIENRMGVHDQTLDTVLRDVARLGAADLQPHEPSEARAPLARYLSDWHLLAFLAHGGLLSDDEMRSVCHVATSHDAGAALDAVLAAPGWRTLAALASDHAAAQAAAEAAAADASAGDGGAAPPSEGRPCPHCTFLNAPGATDCDVCGLPM